MKRVMALAVMVAMAAGVAMAQATGPWSVVKTAKVGGEGGYDHIALDASARRLYVPRIGPTGRISVFNADTLEPVGEIAGVIAHSVALDAASGHGFAGSKPVAMWDTTTLKLIQKIDVQGGPDNILADGGRVYVLGHETPQVTVLNAKDGSIAGTVNVEGGPEQGVSDGKNLYIVLEDAGAIAVVDEQTLKVTRTLSLEGKGGGCTGLALDAKKGVLFATCREPKAMVMVRVSDGKVLGSLPIGAGTDCADFDATTGEAFSANAEGTLTVVKADAAGTYAVEQVLTTKPRARTTALDAKAGKIYTVTADFTPPPANAPKVNGRPPRPTMVPDTFSIMVLGR